MGIRISLKGIIHSLIIISLTVTGFGGSFSSKANAAGDGTNSSAVDLLKNKLDST